MGEFRDKYTNSTNISDIVFFVYVKNSPIILGNVGDSGKIWGKKPISALDQTLKRRICWLPVFKGILPQSCKKSGFCGKEFKKSPPISGDNTSFSTNKYQISVISASKYTSELSRSHQQSPDLKQNADHDDIQQHKIQPPDMKEIRYKSRKLVP